MANQSVNKSTNREPWPQRSVALGHQPQPDEEVHYTTSPFEAPHDARRDVAGRPINPADKRGLFSRSAGTAILILSAVLGAVGVVLTALMHVHISIPLFLVAAGLVFLGRKMVRTSGEKVTQPINRDPQRRREPDFDD